MEINIAFALSQNGAFEKKHFGDADHGTEKKAGNIIDFLDQKDVSVVVSRKFGPNIKHIVKHFIPVEVSEETPIKVQTILLKHMRWLHEELDKQPDYYNKFVINKGILKLTVQ